MIGNPRRHHPEHLIHSLDERGRDIIPGLSRLVDGLDGSPPAAGLGMLFDGLLQYEQVRMRLGQCCHGKKSSASVGFILCSICRSLAPLATAALISRFAVFGSLMTPRTAFLRSSRNASLVFLTAALVITVVPSGRYNP